MRVREPPNPQAPVLPRAGDPGMELKLLAVQNDLNTYRVPSGGDAAIEPQGLDTAIDLKPTLRYDGAHDRFLKVQTTRSLDQRGWTIAWRIAPR